LHSGLDIEVYDLHPADLNYYYYNRTDLDFRTDPTPGTTLLPKCKPSGFTQPDTPRGRL